MDYTVHGILQTKILEWVSVPFCRESSQPRDWTQVSHIAGGFFPSWATGTPRILEWVAYPFSSGSSWPRNRTRISCIAGRFFTNWSIREAEIIVRKWYFRRVLSHHSLIISCYTFTSQFCNIGKSSGYLTWIGFFFFFLRLLMFIFLPFLSCFALNIWDIW